jgi:type I restriction enzyme, S subunit
VKALEGWETKRFDEFGTIYSGSTPSTAIRSFWDGDIVWVTPNDLSKLKTPYLSNSGKRITENGLMACSATLLPERSLVISSRAPIGYVALPTVPFCTNQGCKTIKLKSSYDPEFAYYNVLFNIDKVKNLGEGTTFAEISKSALSTVELSFPTSKPEQAKIADILSTVDRAIEQTEALIAKQQRIKTGLMQDLLTRGIDEHGNLRSEQTHQFKDSPIGRIPVEWDCTLLSRFVPSAEYGISTSLGESGNPVLRMNNLFEGEADISDLKYTDLKVPEKLWLRDGDVLFNRTNSWEHVGRTGIWRGQVGKATFASYLVRLNPDPDMLLSELLNVWLNWEPTQIAMRRPATPAVQQVNINPTNLRAIHAAFPSSLNEQCEIVKRFTSMRKTISTCFESFKKLRSLKTALMQDLLTGKVRITPLLKTERLVA